MEQTFGSLPLCATFTARGRDGTFEKVTNAAAVHHLGAILLFEHTEAVDALSMPGIGPLPQIVCASVLGGWQSEMRPSGTRFGPVCASTNEIWRWQAANLHGGDTLASPCHLRLVFDVRYSLNGTAPDTIKEQLRLVATRSVEEGMLTGATNAEVDDFTITVTTAW